jgi:hypothetical protein
LQRLQDPSGLSGDNPNNVRRETSKHFRNKKREYLKDKINEFKYLGPKIINQNLNQEEIKRPLNYGNACYHSDQHLLSSRLLSNNLKIRIYNTTMLPVVLYRCETWSLTLKKEHRLRVFVDRVLRNICGHKGD